MKHLVPSLALCLVPLAGPASADIAPPRIYRPAKPSVAPDALKETFARFDAALRAKDAAAARAEVDARGWDDNLVGTSGTALSALVSQAIAKGWTLRARWATYREAGPSVMVSADIVQLADGRVSDLAHFVLVKDPDGRWRLLGGGESEWQVRLLSERVRQGGPLAPPATPGRTVP